KMLKASLMMLVLGALLGLGLGLASKFLHVQPDERVDTVAGMLPGYNCGGCGYPGCSGFASAMVEGDTDEFKCRPCKADKKKEIIDYLKNTPGPDGKTVTIKG
uniref:(Fe-S)-binding protein n=1 Tax=Faecalibaculum rodentium TaxID=1702221 RepID=UPI0034CE595D